MSCFLLFYIIFIDFDIYYSTAFGQTFDILLRVNTEESHGRQPYRWFTIPLDWDF
jgi:hypothetical protein